MCIRDREFPPCEEEGAVIGGQPNVSVLDFPKAEEERQEEDPRTARQRLEVEAACVAEKIQGGQMSKMVIL